MPPFFFYNLRCEEDRKDHYRNPSFGGSYRPVFKQNPEEGHVNRFG